MPSERLLAPPSGNGESMNVATDEELRTYRCSHPNCDARLTIDMLKISVLQPHLAMVGLGWRFVSGSKPTIIECPKHRSERLR